MKQVLQMMDTSCRPYLKKVIFGLLSLGIAEFSALWLRTRHIQEFDPLSCSLGDILFIATAAGGIFLLLLNIQRCRRFISAGGFTRIKLLPIGAKSYLYSELLFSFGCFLSLLCVQYAVSWLYLLVQQKAYVMEANAVFLFMLTSDMNTWFVHTLPQLCGLLLIIAFLSYGTLWLSLAFYEEGAWKGRLVTVCSIIAFASLIGILKGFTSVLKLTSDNWYVLGGLLCIPVIVRMHQMLMERFASGRDRL